MAVSIIRQPFENSCTVSYTVYFLLEGPKLTTSIYPRRGRWKTQYWLFTGFNEIHWTH